MPTRPEALRLADLLESCPLAVGDAQQAVAAAELRRLHASCEDYAQHKQRQDQRIQTLYAQRDALLEALQSIADCCDEEHAARDYVSRQTEIRGIARAAIQVVEETK